VQQTVSFFTRNAIANCTANSAASAPASLKRRSVGLSRVSWKLSRTVLRGAVGGNVDCLLDKKLDAKNKQPFGFDLSGGGMLAFAGLWDAWKDPADGRWLQSYTIITTDANEIMMPIHNRMPVILVGSIGLAMSQCAVPPRRRFQSLARTW
jgi:hypothetical protein